MDEIYRYKERFYQKVDEIQVKNQVTREWDVFVLYMDKDGNLYAREINQFYLMFTLYQQAPNFCNVWDKLRDKFTKVMT